MTRISCVASWPGARSACDIVINCNFIVLGTAAWKLTPCAALAAVLGNANLAVMLTMFGLLGSFEGRKRMDKPDCGDVYAAYVVGPDGAEPAVAKRSLDSAEGAADIEA